MSDLAASYERYKRDRNAAFEVDDLAFFARMIPNASVVEMAFHKARMDTMSVSDKKRRESMVWLADRGLADMYGRPVRHDDPLPVGGEP